jgi:hypothetical protein
VSYEKNYLASKMVCTELSAIQLHTIIQYSNISSTIAIEIYRTLSLNFSNVSEASFYSNCLKVVVFFATSYICASAPATGARRDNVGCGNKEYYLCNLYNGTRVENRIKSSLVQR